jgi:AraC-like DNA-binding protein
MTELDVIDSLPDEFADSWRTARVIPRWVAALEETDRNYRGRDHAILYAVFAGTLVIESSGFSCRLEAGRTAIVPPAHQHRLAVPGRIVGDGILRLGFHLHCDPEPNPLSRLALPVVVPMDDPHIWSRRFAVVMDILAGCFRENHSYARRRASCQPEAEWLVLHHCLDGFRHGLLTWSRTGPFAELVRAAILRLRHAGIGRLPSIAAIATELGISPRSLQRAFREHLGTTPRSFRRAMQLQHAARLLAGNPELNVEEVGRRCGFDSPAAFGRAFKDAYGATPLRYRRGGAGIPVI